MLAIISKDLLIKISLEQDGKNPEGIYDIEKLTEVVEVLGKKNALAIVCPAVRDMSSIYLSPEVILNGIFKRVTLSANKELEQEIKEKKKVKRQIKNIMIEGSTYVLFLEENITKE